MRNSSIFPILVIAGAALAGCSSTPKNPLLDEARASFNQAQSDPQVSKRASVELHDADEALNQADRALKKGEDADVVNHYAYIAKQRVAIAEETAKRKNAEAALNDADAERAKVQLDVRTAEAEAARQRAEAAEATAKQREADLQAQSQATEEARREAQRLQEQGNLTSEQLQEAQSKLQQMQAELKDLNAKQTNRGMVITLSDVLFDLNKADLKPGATRSLEKLAQFLKEYPERTVAIEGFTDSTGSEQYNQQLSEQRAQSVRNALAGMGIAADRITTHGYGEQYPVASNNAAAGRQLNRRVEIVLSDEQGNVTARAPEGRGGANAPQESSTASGGTAPAPAMGGTKTEDSETTGVKKSP